LFYKVLLKLDNYLIRIGYRHHTRPDFDTLRGLQRAHVLAVPFENLDVKTLTYNSAAL
jgi:N-hydroxyarylamine O-acetyltransferase